MLFCSIPFLQNEEELMGNIVSQKSIFVFLIPLFKHKESSKASSTGSVRKFSHPCIYISTMGKLLKSIRKIKVNNPWLNQKK